MPHQKASGLLKFPSLPLVWIIKDRWLIVFAPHDESFDAGDAQPAADQTKWAAKELRFIIHLPQQRQISFHCNHCPSDNAVCCFREALANSRLASLDRKYFTREKLVELGLTASFDDPLVGLHLPNHCCEAISLLKNRHFVMISPEWV